MEAAVVATAAAVAAVSTFLLALWGAAAALRIQQEPSFPSSQQIQEGIRRIVYACMCICEHQLMFALLSLLFLVCCCCRRRWWRIWWRCSLCLGLSSWLRLSDGLSATNLGQRALFVRTPQQRAVLSAARLACRGVLCCSGWGPRLWGLCYREQGASASGLLLLCCVSAQRGVALGQHTEEEYRRWTRLFVAWVRLCLHGVGGCAARACAHHSSPHHIHCVFLW